MAVDRRPLWRGHDPGQGPELSPTCPAVSWGWSASSGGSPGSPVCCLTQVQVGGD